MSTYVPNDIGKVVEKRVDPGSPEAEAFYSQFLPALEQHLRRRGLLEKYIQHLADEPNDANADSYRAIAALVRKYAPSFKLLDAAFTAKLEGAVDTWVPHLQKFHENFSFYQQCKQRGDEVWFYTFVGNQGEYANRFMELPRIKTRLVHWVN